MTARHTSLLFVDQAQGVAQLMKNGAQLKGAGTPAQVEIHTWKLFIKCLWPGPDLNMPKKTLDPNDLAFCGSTSWYLMRTKPLDQPTVEASQTSPLPWIRMPGPRTVGSAVQNFAQPPCLGHFICQCGSGS